MGGITKMNINERCDVFLDLLRKNRVVNREQFLEYGTSAMVQNTIRRLRECGYDIKRKRTGQGGVHSPVNIRYHYGTEEKEKIRFCGMNLVKCYHKSKCYMSEYCGAK
jgi:hypothetical protein